jgi:hypothetical protein
MAIRGLGGGRGRELQPLFCASQVRLESGLPQTADIDQRGRQVSSVPCPDIPTSKGGVEDTEGKGLAQAPDDQ